LRSAASARGVILKEQTAAVGYGEKTMESREEGREWMAGPVIDRSWSVTASVPCHLARRQRVDHARLVALGAVARVGAVALVMSTLHCCQVARVDANADTELHITVDG
jgi:hypothetical protein